ncbi:PREDICTED: uncharacterized protein LOC106744850 [Dinoponera quadriceps]|uniref:Uncharacterized protein LOC106744850 n=1 Tax=Dinoponera quadriceps TaxID=609295 RepID=A0A6P3XAZ7_DINQU|nr:PREDICTED: uncharacterized protein LOC106744850 [Dinoponera quadriceps]
MRFALQECADVRGHANMIIADEQAKENTCVAARIYAERFPRSARRPETRVILGAVRDLSETRSFVRNNSRAEDVSVQGPVGDDEKRILQFVLENPGTSVRRLAYKLGLAKRVVYRTLRANGLLYSFQIRQLLSYDQQEKRVYFCQGFLAQYRRDASFPDKILWSGETNFTPNNILNKGHFPYREEENLQIDRCKEPSQHQWSINVWAGMVGNQVIGPHFLPPLVNATIYADFLNNHLPALLSDVPLDVRRELIFHHDGPPQCHFHRQVRDILNMRYPDRWIGRGGPITWPAQSPDLNVLHFFLWRYVEDLIKQRCNSTENEVRDAITAAFDNITPDIACRATRDIIRRADLCIRERGRYFE